MIFDTRSNNIITAYDQIDDQTYLVVGKSDVIPKYDDFLIARQNYLMVFDYVEADGEGFKARLLDTNTNINSNIIPNERKLRRAVLSQMRRDSR